VRIPIRGTAETMLAFGAGGKHRGFVPAATGRIWRSSENMAQVMTVGTFVPVIWLGDDRNGLFWVADNDKGWAPSDDHEAGELFRQKDGSLLLVHNLIKQPEGFRLDKPRTISFWLLPTPAVPYRADWRLGSSTSAGSSGCFSRDGNFATAHRYDPQTKVNGWMWYHPETTDPDPAAWEKYYRKMRHSNSWEQTKICFATTWGVQSAMKKEGAYFRAEWGDNEYTPSLLDYYAWLFNKYVRDGDLDFIYQDVMNIVPYRTLSTGTAYYLPDGRVQPGFVISARREHNKRLAAVFVESRKRPWVGGNNIALLPATTFMTSYLTGDDNVSPGGELDFAELRPSAFLRACSIPEIMGGVHRPFFTYGKGNWRIIRGHLALHNILGDSTSGMWIRGIRNIYARGDLTRFHAYWRNADRVKVAMKGVKPGEVKCSVLQQVGDHPDETDLHIFAFNYSKTGEARGSISLALTRFVRGAQELSQLSDISIPYAQWRPLTPKAIRDYEPAYEGRVSLDASDGTLIVQDVRIPKRDLAEWHVRLK